MDERKESRTARGLKSLKTDTRGAVLAEFVIAIIPLLTVFFVFVQISALSIAKLLVKHSTIVGARAAAVFSNQHENCPECTSDGRAVVTAAVRSALVNWQSKFTSVTADVEDNSSREIGDDQGYGPYGLVTVRVEARYKCEIPLGKVICSGGGNTVLIRETKTMPHQGARYTK